MNLTLGCVKNFSGEISIPGSKSHTIRALLIATLARGTSVLHNALLSDDTKSCIEACKTLGAKIDVDNQTVTVAGIDRFFNFNKQQIDVGNSGTTLFFLASILALQEKPIILTGDSSIKSRKIEPLLNALESIGANIKYLEKHGYVPVAISGKVKSGKINIDCPTSQYLSSLLISLPLADGNFDIHVGQLLEKPYVEITLDWLDNQFIMLEKSEDLKKFFVPGGQNYRSINTNISADFSSAAFFLVAAAITGGPVVFNNLNIKDKQGDKEVLFILERAGAKVDFDGVNFTISAKKLIGQKIDMENIPDSLPILAVFGCFAEGETLLYNAAHTRAKECDRISAMAKELKKMGADVIEKEDSLTIKKSNLVGTTVDGYCDHRVVMSLAVASLMAKGETTILGAEYATVTFPNFFELLSKLSKC